MSGTRNLDGLKTQALHCIEDAYIKGYKSGLNDGNINDGTFAAKVKEAYDNGLNDAWECVGKMERLLYSDVFSNVFGNTDFYTVVTKMSASEAMTKIKEYEEKKAERNASPDNEIHVGDEVYCLDSKYKYVVLSFLDNGKIFVFSSRGLTGIFTFNQLHKTGRNYPVKEILEKLSESEE